MFEYQSLLKLNFCVYVMCVYVMCVYVMCVYVYVCVCVCMCYKFHGFGPQKLIMARKTPNFVYYPCFFDKNTLRMC